MAYCKFQCNLQFIDEVSKANNKKQMPDYELKRSTKTNHPYKTQRKKKDENLHDHNVKIDNRQNWKTKHWKSIQNAYRSSPFFEFYEEEFSNVFFNNEKLLYSSNINMILHINQILGIKKEIKISNKKITHDKYDKRLIDVKNYSNYDIPQYNQVFMSKFKFISNLSILDLLFNMGPKSINYLTDLKLSQFHSN